MFPINRNASKIQKSCFRNRAFSILLFDSSVRIAILPLRSGITPALLFFPSLQLLVPVSPLLDAIALIRALFQPIMCLYGGDFEKLGLNGRYIEYTLIFNTLTVPDSYEMSRSYVIFPFFFLIFLRTWNADWEREKIANRNVTEVHRL